MDAPRAAGGRARSVDRQALSRLGRDFPALCHVLGGRRFTRFAVEALELAAATGGPPGWAMEQVVVARLMRLRARRAGRAPSRLAADVAAVEHALVAVSEPEGAAQGGPRDPAGESGAASGEGSAARPLPLSCAELPEGEALERAVLAPIDALRVVPVAFALEAYLRRVREGRRPPLPRRADHTVVAARPRFEPYLSTLTHGEGRLLATLMLGATVGEAIATAVAQGWLPDAPTAHATLHDWIASGFFAEVRESAAP